MGKKIKFKYYEIENTGKVLVYIDYVDRDFFNDNFYEEWEIVYKIKKNIDNSKNM